MHKNEHLIESPVKEFARLEKLITLWNESRDKTHKNYANNHNYLENYRRLVCYYNRRDKLRMPIMLQKQAA